MFQLIIRAARTNSVATTADASLKPGSATTKTIVGMVAMKKAAFTHLAHQENSLAPTIAASRNPRCATALMIVKTMLHPTRRMSDALVTLHAR